MLDLDLTIPGSEIAAFCQRCKIRKLALFGVILRGDFRHERDMDVLVDFAPGEATLLGIVKAVRLVLTFMEDVTGEAFLTRERFVKHDELS